MVSISDEEMISQPEIEPDLNQMAQKVQGPFKFKRFYDQLDFNSQQLVITKAIIELTDPSKNSNLVKEDPEETTGLKMTHWYYTK